MSDVIHCLSDKIDESTKKMLPVIGSLILMGDANSQFLNVIRKKAEKFGVQCRNTIGEDMAGIVVDIETADVSNEFMEELHQSPFDIDGPYINGMTSVSQAIYMVLDEQDLIKRKNIIIVGRGYSVTGLADKLIQNDATVTVCHSKTKDVFGVVDGCDVAIYATPTLSICEKPYVNDMVIDLGGVWSKNRYATCQYIDRIGPLTISILLNRLAKLKTT